jgi:hypothetical protein
MIPAPGLDTIQQAKVFGRLDPGEASIVALLPAFVPSLVPRRPVARIARRLKRSKEEETSQ